LRCTELAEQADSPTRAQVFRNLAKQWLKMAIELLRAPPAGRSGRARAAHADQREILEDSTSFRLHGETERAESACSRAQARLAVRHHVHLVLSLAARAQTCRAFRYAALAGSAVPRSSDEATDYFQIPTDRVVEVGTQVTV
jgi:K+ transporter